MFAKISHIFNRINDRFTYRQRFIFFSCVYILTTPFPGYWLLRVENFFINRAEWQINGDRYQEVIGGLIDDITQIQLTAATSELETENELFNRSISSKLKKLEVLNKETSNETLPSLGFGFSETIANPLETEKFISLWDEPNYPELLNELYDALREVGDTYQLIVPETEVQHHLLATTLYIIPALEITLVKLFQQNITPLNQLVLLQQLNNLLIQLNHRLSIAYVDYETVYDGEHKTLIAAKNSFSESRVVVEDFIQNPTAAKGNQVLSSLSLLREINVKLANAIFENQLLWYRFAKNSSLLIYILVAVILTFYICFRVLTRHLMEICYHLRDMTKGHFKRCFCSGFNDEFGMIGRTFDKMGQTVQDVLKELKKLGTQLTDSINQITKTAKIQESNAHSQEQQVREIEDTAKQIATEARNLANNMSEISASSTEVAVADAAKETLDRLEEKMTVLANASTDIVASLSVLQDKVDSSNTLIAFMNKVSDQASLLSLNSAIETANIVKHKASFLKITQEIQRFAEKTAIATQDIKKIIDEISHSVSNVRGEAKGCLNEITEGAHRLINVSNQLSSITKQGKEQINKYANVNEVMQMQAIAAENIINSITNLGETAQENTRSIRLLHQSIEELGQTAEELQKTIGMFV